MAQVIEYASSGRGLFGLTDAGTHAAIAVIGVPWEATVSYGVGTAQTPFVLPAASSQMDTSVWDIKDPSANLSLSYRLLRGDWKSQNDTLRERITPYMARIEEAPHSQGTPKNDAALCKTVNRACSNLINAIEKETRAAFEATQWPVLLGGDHSIALGGIRAANKRFPELGVLQFDAHMDLRAAYQGFKYSHASLMDRVLAETKVKKIIQFGIRDYDLSEQERAEQQARIVTFYDDDIQAQSLQGKPFQRIVEDLLAHLPKTLYVSVDVDGFSSHLCPHTGTPVAGGFSFAQWDYLMRAIVRSGKQIMGADMCEYVSSSHRADTDLATRILYRLCVFLALSQNLLQWNTDT